MVRSIFSQLTQTLFMFLLMIPGPSMDTPSLPGRTGSTFLAFGGTGPDSISESVSPLLHISDSVGDGIGGEWTGIIVEFSSTIRGTTPAARRSSIVEGTTEAGEASTMWAADRWAIATPIAGMRRRARGREFTRARLAESITAESRADSPHGDRAVLAVGSMAAASAEAASMAEVVVEDD